MQKNNQPKFYKSLEGIRALSVLAVIAFHLWPNVFSGGFAGVTVFFVLSGFLTSESLLKNYETNGNLNYFDYLKKRFWRLYPAFIVMILSTIATIAFVFKDALYNVGKTLITNIFYVNNWYQIFAGQSYFDKSNNWSVFTHLWSLSVEAQFYVFWPLIMLVLVKVFKKNYKAYLLAITVLIIVSAFLFALFFNPDNSNRSYYGTDTRAFSFLIGVAVSVLSKQLKGFMKGILIFQITSVGGILFFFVTMNGYQTWVYDYGMLVLSLIAGISVLVFVNSEPNFFSRIMGNRVFLYIGSRSYSIYLYQLPILVIAEHYIKKESLLLKVALVVLILFFAELSYQLVENNFRKGIKTAKVSKFMVLPMMAFIVFLFVGNFLGLTSGYATHNYAAIKLKKDLNKKSSEIKKKNKEALEARKESSSEVVSSQPSQETSEISSSEQPDVASSSSQSEVQTNTTDLSNIEMTGIGDSVMIAVSSSLQSIFPKTIFDAQVGRHTLDAVSVLNNLNASNQLDQNLLLIIGMNGTITPDQVQQIMDIVGPDRNVFWVNNYAAGRPWIDGNNFVLNEQAKIHPNLHVIDWFDQVNANPNLVVSDGTHPTYEGIEVMDRLITDKISSVIK
ncbi:MAG: acetyltransferase [Lactobacillaceae bacterium]|jgi:peptidoglycan/LPS O-acetylase OafA/YrhL|nr:acetyltransferase [Lactobacillaceae bacterium]